MRVKRVYLKQNLKPAGSGWGDFGDWSPCSAECGGGTQTRVRSCNSLDPAAECLGDAEETQQCNTHTCSGKFCFDDFKMTYHVVNILLLTVLIGVLPRGGTRF